MIWQNAVILPGVLIGDGVIIIANCVVDSNVEPYGSLARMFKKLYDDMIYKIDNKIQMVGQKHRKNK